MNQISDLDTAHTKGCKMLKADEGVYQMLFNLCASYQK